MKYYRMQFRDAVRAQELVWQTQDTLGMLHTRFNMSAEGTDTSLWTTETYGEEQLRAALTLLGISYEESDT